MTSAQFQWQPRQIKCVPATGEPNRNEDKIRTKRKSNGGPTVIAKKKYTKTGKLTKARWSVVPEAATRI